MPNKQATRPYAQPQHTHAHTHPQYPAPQAGAHPTGYGQRPPPPQTHGGYQPHHHPHQHHQHVPPPPPPNPLARYDVFSSHFDIRTFQHAHQQAYLTTTPSFMDMVGGASMAGGAAGGAGGFGFSGGDWAQSFNGGFGFEPPTTTTPTPPTTTMDFRVNANPGRLGAGFYLDVPNRRPRPMPATEIIQIQKWDNGNGITVNPLSSWLGKTAPPPVKETTPLPGRDGNIMSGFLGFHSADHATPPPAKAMNAINSKFQKYFAPVPIDSGNGGGQQNSPWNSFVQGGPPPQHGRQPMSGGPGGKRKLPISDAQLERRICESFGMLCNRG